MVLQWLHQGCDSDLLADFLKFGTCDCPLKIPLKKCFKIFIFLWRHGPALELQFLMPLRVVLLCLAPIVMAVSRLLGAAAARVIPLSFAAGHR